MVSDFVEGFNVTCIAYGQTGSGKTYTMGSMDQGAQTNETIGIIPRFVEELFRCTSALPSNHSVTLYTSFLEIYGEDIYDLLDRSQGPGGERRSMQIREATNGAVSVADLTHVPVVSCEDAMNTLVSGGQNRSTASTLMNMTSSRSHAVFTVTLEQSIERTEGGVAMGEEEGEKKSSMPPLADGTIEDAVAETTDVAAASGASGSVTTSTMFSKLTFVDLAGSERLKRTGAEGQRMREGIQINVGLLALGNVINALGDDQKKHKAKDHVPYRSSKLTRLLQDALGGNSQTLFIACVSPACSNFDETLNTLRYANRARNIQNKAVQNIDAQSAELMRLQQLCEVFKCELVFEKFACSFPANQLRQQTLMASDDADGVTAGADGNGGQGERPSEDGADAEAGAGGVPIMERMTEATALMHRLDVRGYLQQIYGTLSVDGVTMPSYRPMPISRPRTSISMDSAAMLMQAALPPLAPKRAGSLGRSASAAGRKSLGDKRNRSPSPNSTAVPEEGAADGGAAEGTEDGEGVEDEEDCEAEVDIEQVADMEMLDELIAMQKKEDEYKAQATADELELQNVEKEISGKERLLQQLAERMQQLHHVKGKYDELLQLVTMLEHERDQLSTQLQMQLQAEERDRQNRKLKGHKEDPAANLKAKEEVAKYRKKLEDVSSRLQALRVQQRKQRQVVRVAEQQTTRSHTLKSELQKLKEQKVGMQRKQNQQAAKHRRWMEDRNKEVEIMRILYPYCTHTVLVLYSYCTHTVLILYSYCAHTVLILYSYCTHTVLILYSYCTHTVLILHSYCTHTVPILYSYCTHTIPILYSYCTHTVLILYTY
jgi:kinesin family protein 4/21/27